MAYDKELLNKVDPEYLNVLLPRLSFGLGEWISFFLFLLYEWNLILD